MKVVVVSYFRDAARYITRYVDQMRRFQTELNNRGYELSLVLGFGDSRDGTGEMLRQECGNHLRTLLVDVSHGGEHYGSVVHPVRFKQLAALVNRLWQEIPEDADVVALVESDLIFSGRTLASLVDALEASRSLCSPPTAHTLLAPMVLNLFEHFYDEWAFRKDGQNFKHHAPFHPGLNGEKFCEMDSVGSVVFMDGDLARKLTWPEEDVVVGFCRLAKEQGAKIYLMTDAEVFH